MKSDGGPAFPRDMLYPDLQGGVWKGIPGWDGMSLRDYFAGQALAGFFAHPDVFAPYAGKGERPAVERAERMVSSIAATAYQVADAMLAARSTEPTEGGGGDG